MEQLRIFIMHLQQWTPLCSFTFVLAFWIEPHEGTKSAGSDDELTHETEVVGAPEEVEPKQGVLPGVCCSWLCRSLSRPLSLVEERGGLPLDMPFDDNSEFVLKLTFSMAFARVTETSTASEKFVIPFMSDILLVYDRYIQYRKNLKISLSTSNHQLC